MIFTYISLVIDTILLISAIATLIKNCKTKVVSSFVITQMVFAIGYSIVYFTMAALVYIETHINYDKILEN